MTNFPTSLQDLDATRGTSGDKLSSPNHITHHIKEDATIEALQAKVGIDDSAVVTSLDYIAKNANSDGGGHVQTAAKGGTGQTTFTKGDLLVASAATTLTKLGVGASDGLVLQVDNAETTGMKWGRLNFGGTGADGALTITSGTTTIDCANAATVIKNYTSISITGNGKLAFSNPNDNGTVIMLKSQGDVILTSSQAPMIDCSKLGSTGIGYGVCGNCGAGGNGNPGLARGVGGTAFFPKILPEHGIAGKIIRWGLGARGGDGIGYTGYVALGGRGGGALIIECGGSLNFTTTNGISVQGETGATPPPNTNTFGGGGGGGGGSCWIVYNSLIANTGTVIIAGGSGGGGGSNGAGGGGGGVGGPGDGGGSSGPAGDGGIGMYKVVQNTELI